jgi:hypothetical protein
MDAVERTQSWREQKRQQGYRPLTVWLPAALKARIEDLAYQRRQEVAELIADAFADWQPFKAGKPAAPTDRRQIQAMVAAAVQAELAKLQGTAPSLPQNDISPARNDILYDNGNTVLQERSPQQDFDATKYRLGKLCPQGHDYQGTGQSLLRQRQGDCVECGKLGKRQKRQLVKARKAGLL